MGHTTGAQGSPDFVPEGIVHPMSSRIFVVRLENRRLDTLTSPMNGRILASGGAYGNCSCKIAILAPMVFYMGGEVE
jgi:hypothetical protein